MNDSNHLPIACTLSPQELRDGRHDLLPGLIVRADSVTDLANGLRLHFTPHSGLLGELARIIEQEMTCCQFLRFQIEIEPKAAAVTLEVTGPDGTRELLRAL